MTRDPTESDAADEFDPVAAAIAAEFPTRPVSGWKPVETGNRKRTVVVRFGDESTPAAVVVQTGPDQRALATETTLTRAIATRTDLPVARVLGAGSIASLTDEPADEGTDVGGYLVTERRPGTDLHERFVALDPAIQQAVARTFGRALARLHEEFQFDGYGPVELGYEGAIDWQQVLNHPDPGRLLGVGVDTDDDSHHTSSTDRDGVPATTDWPAWVRSYATAGIDRLPAAFDDLRPRLRARVDADVASLPTAPRSTLYPWDLRPGNALVEGGTVTALLDWGEPLAAAAGLGVANVEHLVCDWYVADADQLRRAFRAGYADVRPLPSVPAVYRLVAVVASAVDGEGVVTRPRYPELTGDDAVGFHRERLQSILE